MIRPHQEIQALTFEEKKFLLAVERGDVAGTRRLVSATPKYLKTKNQLNSIICAMLCWTVLSLFSTKEPIIQFNSRFISAAFKLISRMPLSRSLEHFRCVYLSWFIYCIAYVCPESIRLIFFYRNMKKCKKICYLSIF